MKMESEPSNSGVTVDDVKKGAFKYRYVHYSRADIFPHKCANESQFLAFFRPCRE